VKADLHVHSFFSHDAISKPESILSAAAERGIGLIAITDHETTEGWSAFSEIAHKFPVQVIFGQEIKVYIAEKVAGELVCLFLSSPVKSKTIPEVIEEVHRQNGLVSIAHPFTERRVEFKGFSEITNWDNLAIEVINGRLHHPRDNEMAQGLAKRLNTAITAGSNAHTPFEVGNSYLEFSGKSANDLRQAIARHEVQAVGKSSSVFFSLVSGFRRFGLAV
jgi:predicted metal-dependent phosphoesterase TrpH